MDAPIELPILCIQHDLMHHFITTLQHLGSLEPPNRGNSTTMTHIHLEVAEQPRGYFTLAIDLTHVGPVPPSSLLLPQSSHHASLVPVLLRTSVQLWSSLRLGDDKFRF